jgi:uncharacterized NAD(P)/FAD-binding protein YdhS
MSRSPFLGSRPQVIAIVGGGFSGTLVAVHLARLAGGPPIKVLLFERGERFARGVAYGTSSPHHLLNVPAGMMSALPDEPAHFLEWLQARDPDAHAGTFAPRRLYGEYLEELLTHAARWDGAAIELIRGEIVDVCEDGPGVTLRGRDGSRTRAHRAVLALGHPRPGDPLEGAEALKANGVYRENPWEDGVLDGLTPGDAIVLIGSGLSAVDLIVEARANDLRGPITVVSRHGLFPRAHRSFFPCSTSPIDLDGFTTLPSVLSHLRREAARCEREGGDWRAAVDALRPHLQRVWRSFGATEKERFLRHLVSLWDVHRHRVAPEIDRILQEARRAGQLTGIAGRVRGIEERGDGVAIRLVRRGRPDEETLLARRVINCTGPSRDVRADHSPLVEELIARGLARPDALGMGLEAAESGALLNAAGVRSERLFTLGPLLKGQLWETTAVRELRNQALDLARHIAAIAGDCPRVRCNVAC